LNIKFLSRQEQGQEITTEKTINLLTDKGKIWFIGVKYVIFISKLIFLLK
jgi:hypothetical protein